MTPCTRSTLFRVILAIYLFDVGLIEAGRYALPKKWKVRYWDPYRAWQMRKLIPIIMESLRNSFVAMQLVNREYEAMFTGKVGDAISVRRPERFAV